MDLTLKQKQIDKICSADHPDPFSFLGLHRTYDPVKRIDEFAIRVFLPNASRVILTDISETDDLVMHMLDGRGFFEAALPFFPEHSRYGLRVTNKNGTSYESYDPFSFGVVMSDYDIYLFNEGNHSEIYKKLGAHHINIDEIWGVYFSVWAPNAKRVSVVGSFNEWDGRRHPMRKLGLSGIFEIFIPGLNEYDLYKFEIKTMENNVHTKADPYAFYCELRPKTASIVYDINKYVWSDEEWMQKRENSLLFDRPVAIYECHLQSWMRDPSTNYYISYKDIAPQLTAYVKQMGYTHVELMPVMEHPYDGSWGYQVTGYYAATSRFGEPTGLMYLIDMLHQNDIGVLLDWVPGHFPKDSFSLERFDGTCLYEYSDPTKAEHRDWGTLVFNYERNEVKSFLISNAVFWLDKFHADGLRVDAVASMLYLDYSKKGADWVPNKYGGRENIEAVEFIRHLNSVVYSYFPNTMMIAEESTSYPLVTHPTYSGGLGFSYKWNMGWMNDIIKYLNLDPVYRKHHHNLITFSMMYNFTENFILPLSHDEAVHGKGSLINKISGDDRYKFSTLRTSFAFMFAHPGKKMLFMGSDLAQKREWNYDIGLDWHLLNESAHKDFNLFVKDLLHIYTSHAPLYELDYSPDGFEWINPSDKDKSIFSFIRYSKDKKSYLVCVFNFTPVTYENYTIGVPKNIPLTELLNSDSVYYGGSNIGNLGKTQIKDVPANNQPYSASITVPSAGALYFEALDK